MKTAYSYTILRYVHDTATSEFVNVGVVLYAPGMPFAGALCRPTALRVSKIFPGLNVEAFKRLMKQVGNRIEEAGSQLEARSKELNLDAKPESVMTLAHSILPADDSSLQWSPPGGGLTSDPAKTLEQLYARMVTRYDDKAVQTRRDDDDVWRSYKKALESRQVLKYLETKKIVAQDDVVEFDKAWKNGVWNCLEPMSFDLASAETINDKAYRLLGRMSTIKDAPERFKLFVLLGEPRQEELRPAFKRAMKMLDKLPVDHELVPEADAESFIDRLATQMVEHHAETVS